MTTMSATSCAQPAAVIRTAPGRAGRRPGTDRARSPGRCGRCSRRSLGYTHGLTVRVALGRRRSEFFRDVGSDDAVAAAHQPDAQREERNDFFFFNHATPPYIYFLSLRVALPI